MVALARAVAIDAKLLIMDEPTSRLEPREVETLFAKVRELAERNIAVIYVSHRLDELYRLCDRSPCCATAVSCTPGRWPQMTSLRLISTMLGRELGRRGGHQTPLGPRDGERAAAERGWAHQATPVARHQFQRAARRGGGARRPARLGPFRDGQGGDRGAAARLGLGFGGR